MAFPNPSAANRAAWIEQYFINQWDAMEQTYNVILALSPGGTALATEATLAAFKTANNTDLSAINARLFSNGVDLATWVWSIHQRLVPQFALASYPRLATATAATHALAMTALCGPAGTIATLAAATGSSNYVIDGIVVTQDNTLFSSFTASAVIRVYS